MKSTSKIIKMLLLGVLPFLLFACGDEASVFYIVHEDEQVVITQSGRPVGQPIADAGLKIKTPFIQKVHRFNKGIIEWDGSLNRIFTRDKKFILLDKTARWRITDALKFYNALRTEANAQSRLRDIIKSVTRDLVTARLLGLAGAFEQKVTV